MKIGRQTGLFVYQLLPPPPPPPPPEKPEEEPELKPDEPNEEPEGVLSKDAKDAILLKLETESVKTTLEKLLFKVSDYQVGGSLYISANSFAHFSSSPNIMA